MAETLDSLPLIQATLDRGIGWISIRTALICAITALMLFLINVGLVEMFNGKVESRKRRGKALNYCSI